MSWHRLVVIRLESAPDLVASFVSSDQWARASYITETWVLDDQAIDVTYDVAGGMLALDYRVLRQGWLPDAL